MENHFDKKQTNNSHIRQLEIWHLSDHERVTYVGAYS